MGLNFFLGVFRGSTFYLVAILWVQIFSWYFVGSNFFLVVLNFFLVGISWVQILSHVYLVGPKCFLWYFLGSNFLLVDILWVWNFSSWVFSGSKIFHGEYFVGRNFFTSIFRRCLENILVRGTITNKCRRPPAPING